MEKVSDANSTTTRLISLTTLGKYVDVSYTPEGEFILAVPEEVVKGVSGSTKYMDSETVKMKKTPDELYETMVNADYVARFGPFGASFVPHVDLFMKQGYPFASRYKADGIQLDYYIIPTVTGDE